MIFDLLTGRNFGDEGLFFLAESLGYNQVLLLILSGSMMSCVITNEHGWHELLLFCLAIFLSVQHYDTKCY